MTTIVMQTKGSNQLHEGKFFGIITNKYSKDALSIIQPCETVTACDTSGLLRYWYKNKWIYVANTKRS